MDSTIKLIIQWGIRIALLCSIVLMGPIACKGSQAQQPPTSTPLPSATETPPPTDTPTLEPTATHDLPATFEAEITQKAEKALEDILVILEEHGYKAEDGQLAWLGSKKIMLSVDTYSSWDFEFIDPDLVVKDFVLQTDVTWESTGGLAACGLVFRADEDLERGAYYEFMTIRLSGLPMWFVDRVDYNTIQDDMTTKYPFSSAINQKQGSTNTYLLIAKENSFTFYANNDRLGTVFNSKLEKGRVAFMVSQESGETSCVFENSWLWTINKP
jgi:hypothetical protein